MTKNGINTYKCNFETNITASPEIFSYVVKLQKTNAVLYASDAIRKQLKVNDWLQSYLFQWIRLIAV